MRLSRPLDAVLLSGPRRQRRRVCRVIRRWGGPVGSSPRCDCIWAMALQRIRRDVDVALGAARTDGRCVA